MKIHARIVGSGPDLVMIHGWGLHSRIWGEAEERLAQGFRLTLVDLPGHGRSPMPADGFGLADLAQAVSAAAPARAHWLGWSLGGMVAMQAALTAPQRVARLVAVCSSPRFTQAPDWPQAMAPQVLAGFARDLGRDFHATLMRFLALQARGSEDARGSVRLLRQRLAEEPAPQPAALAAGLEILRSADLRADVGRVSCPTLLIYGQQDMLVPARAAEPAQKLFGDAHLRIIHGAGHAPFISHVDQFAQSVMSFLHE